MEWARDDGYTVSDARDRIDREQVWRWMSEEAYWSLGRERAVQDRAIDESLCFGLYAPDGTLAGFCRYVTDYATFAWLCDVYVDGAHRGCGAGRFLVSCAVAHPAVTSLGRQVLSTRDAHGLYEQLGYRRFTEADMARWMIRGA